MPNEAMNAMSYQGMQAETVSFRAHNSDQGEAYYARPLGAGPFRAWSSSITCPAGTSGPPRWRANSPITAMRRSRRTCSSASVPAARTTSPRARAPAGGAPTSEVMGDVAACMAFLRALPNANGKIGVIGFCSGGRHSYLAACTLPGIDAAVDCWGGRVIVDDPKEFTPQRPVAPIDLTAKLTCPLLGIFGNDDKNPDRRPGQPHRGGAQAPRQELRIPPLRRRRPRVLQVCARPIGRSRRSTAGERSSRSSTNIWPARR